MEVKKPNKPLIFYAFIVMVVLILLNALVIPSITERSVVETTYDQFLGVLEKHYVTKVEISEEDETIYYLVENGQGQQMTCKTGKMEDPLLISRLEESGAKFGRVIPTQQSPLLSFLLGWIFPIAIFIFLG